MNLIVKTDVESNLNEVNVTTTLNTTSNNMQHRMENSMVFNNGNGLKEVLTS